MFNKKSIYSNRPILNSIGCLMDISGIMFRIYRNNLHYSNLKPFQADAFSIRDDWAKINYDMKKAMNSQLTHCQ